ncbi:DEAD/DEAH box helicase family protein [Promicromonospora aerolata]|uniref:DEAD/DEAH box helicase family protein n=1 Tax=Promicromonospora aerolata TaxID=195749 RepID=A0ABW4V3E1_9MICO
MSNFGFLKDEFPQVFGEAERAERYVRVDPRVSGLYARRALEQALGWAFQADGSLTPPYKTDLSAMIHEPGLRELAGNDVQSKMNLVRKKTNRAVHDDVVVQPGDSEATLGQLFHVLVWFHRTYTRQSPITYAARLNPSAFPDPAAAKARSRAEVTKLAEELAARDAQIAAEQARSADLEEQLTELRRDVAKAKKENLTRPDTHDYDEATTRAQVIDDLLIEAGFPVLPHPHEGVHASMEYPVTGLPGGKSGKVDYVLWGADGLPLAVVEAKRTQRDARAGQHQARAYADALEQAFPGRRPLIYYTNGHEHWLWDDHERVGYPQRKVAGFRTADQLEWLIGRRRDRRDLNQVPIDEEIAGRYYQLRAVEAVDKAFQTKNERAALLVMATGSGKTRTVVALADQLAKAGWVKRVLFLADRKALVRQAVAAFKKHLPDANPVNLLEEKDSEGRVYVSTYPTMMNLLAMQPGKYGPGYFDVVVIDEAHRSVYQKYGAIFDWFDAHLVGLTATPKDEVDRNTYDLFGLEAGAPTYEYGLDQAIADGYLVPPVPVDIELGFPRRGIRYADLSEEEKDAWDTLDWGEEDDDVPDEIDAEAVNRWLFNADTVDKVLEVLMTQGIKVAGGERVGKTIIFAKNDAHAKFIAERFDHHYKHYQGKFANVITYSVERADQLLEDFSDPAKTPHIAISVDMLDTGIDVPEVVNLVFFKRVRSVTKFWQMMGRGTRLSGGLFGPGQDKKEFYVFDFCGNLDYFGQNPKGTESKAAPSVPEQIFTNRVELLLTLRDQAGDDVLAAVPGKEDGTTSLAALRADVADALTARVRGMDTDNFLVRPHRPWVATYSDREAWGALTDQAAPDIVGHLAALPSAAPEGEELAKRFDLTLLRLQLGTLKPDLYAMRLQSQVQEIAGGLLEAVAVPEVGKQVALLEAIAGDEWWTDATVPLLELVRRRVRGLVKYLPKHKRAPVYTNFEDTLGDLRLVDLNRPIVGVSPERLREKARSILRKHADNVTLQRVRLGNQLTQTDLDQLGRLLVEAGAGTEQDVAAAGEQAGGLGVFVRSIVGLDPAAAADAFAEFLHDRNFDADQIRFIDAVVADLSYNGVLDPGLLYRSPFTDDAPGGPNDLFDEPDVARIISIVREVSDTAKVVAV